MRARFVFAVWAVVLLLGAAAATAGGGPRKTTDLVDINRATVQELLAVPGMTASWAARIVRFRPYRSKLDLVEQGVVPQEVYRRIRDGVIAHRISAEEAKAQNAR